MNFLKLFVLILLIFVGNFNSNVLMIAVVMDFVVMVKFVNVIIFIKDQLVQKNKAVIMMILKYALNCNKLMHRVFLEVLCL